MKKIILLLLAFTLIISAQPKGHLFIIGGGAIPDYMVQKYVDLAGGKDSGFLIIPMASEAPQAAALSFIKKLRTAGCTKLEFIICNKETADNDSSLAKVKDIKGVFFTGGDQSKLTEALLGTKLLESIKAIYDQGGVVGGTSAGAAVMSSVMITGEEMKSKDTVNAFSSITKENVKTARGFGFIDNAIVDQHFLKRKRMNRLLSLVLENPQLPGIGIDESTAIIVNPDHSFNVLGESLVTVVDASRAKGIKTDKNNHLSANNIQMHLLQNGDTYCLSNHSQSQGENGK